MAKSRTNKASLNADKTYIFLKQQNFSPSGLNATPKFLPQPFQTTQTFLATKKSLQEMTDRCGKKVKIFLKKKVGQQKRRGHPYCHDLLQKNAPPIQFLHVSMDTFVETNSWPPQKWWLEDPSSGLVHLVSEVNRYPPWELSPYPENCRLKSGDC